MVTLIKTANGNSYLYTFDRFGMMANRAAILKTKTERAYGNIAKIVHVEDGVMVLVSYASRGL